MANETQRDSALLIALLGLVAIALMLVINTNKLNERNETIMALESEILEWQRASMPAVRSRGWMEVKPEDLVPRDLVDVLDPCKEKNRLGRELLNGSVCAGRTMLPYGSKGVPIQIRMAENWPTR
jgi:hypothetical protein